MSEARRRHPVPQGPCPALRATYGGCQLPVALQARVRDLEVADVKLRCLLRPGVALSADYVVDMCLGRAYGEDACLFAAQRDDGGPGLTWVSGAGAAN